MKLLSILILLAGFSGAVTAQEIDERLVGDRYSEKQLLQLKESDPDEYELLVYAYDNAIYFAHYDEVKGMFEEIDADENSSFIDLGLEIKEQNQYFKVKGQDRLLVVKSKWVLNYEKQK